MAPSSSSPSSSSLQAALERFQRERQAFLRALVDLTKPQVFRGFCSRVRHAPLGGPLPSSFDPPLQRAVKRGQPPRLPSHKRTQHADAMLALGCVAVLRGLLQDDVPRCGGGGGMLVAAVAAEALRRRGAAEHTTHNARRHTTAAITQHPADGSDSARARGGAERRAE